MVYFLYHKLLIYGHKINAIYVSEKEQDLKLKGMRELKPCRVLFT
jgi:hypothetical protein